MIRKHHILKITLIVILLLGNAANSIGSDKPALMEKIITVIKNCMTGSPGSWPNRIAKIPDFRQEMTIFCLS